MNQKTDSLNYQLGFYVGEYIILTELPTLSTDMLLSRNVIQVSEEETNLWNTKRKVWEDMLFLKDSDDEREKVFYENLKWYKRNLEEKYLPKTLKVKVPKVYPTDLNEFAEGIEAALWDCDLSHYRIAEEFFEQTEEYAWCSYIVLKKTQENIPEKFA